MRGGRGTRGWGRRRRSIVVAACDNMARLLLWGIAEVACWGGEGSAFRARRRGNERGALFNELTIAYLFLGGTGGGTLAVLCSVSLWEAFRPSVRRVHFSRQYGQIAWGACLFILVLAVLCLLFDMGVPGRALGFLLPQTFTVTTLGSWALLISLALGAIFWIVSVFDGIAIWRGVAIALAIVGIVAGLTVALYTGALLQQMVSVLAWQTPLVPLLFCLSSLSCGLAVAAGMVGFVPARAHFMQTIEVLLRADWLVIVLELVLLAVYVGWLFSSTATAHFALAITVGYESLLFWGFLVGCGLVVPLFVERSVTYSNHRTQLLFVALCVLAGGLALRLVVVGLFPLDVTQAADAVFRAADSAASAVAPGIAGG